jgi:hypothetical protein
LKLTTSFLHGTHQVMLTVEDDGRNVGSETTTIYVRSYGYPVITFLSHRPGELFSHHPGIRFKRFVDNVVTTPRLSDKQNSPVRTRYTCCSQGWSNISGTNLPTSSPKEGHHQQQQHQVILSPSSSSAHIIRTVVIVATFRPGSGLIADCD